MDNKKVNSEVLGVLMALGIEHMNKIPKHVMEYLTSNCDKESIPRIDSAKPIDEQPISRDAKNFLTLLNLQYICDDEEKKEAIMNKIVKNTKNSSKS